MDSFDFLTLFDGVCDQKKVLQTLSISMSNNVKWIISSSGRYMFLRFAVNTITSSTGFFAKIHYGNEIINDKVTVSILGLKKLYLVSRHINLSAMHNIH